MIPISKRPSYSEPQRASVRRLTSAHGLPESIIFFGRTRDATARKLRTFTNALFQVTASTNISDDLVLPLQFRVSQYINPNEGDPQASTAATVREITATVTNVISGSDRTFTPALVPNRPTPIEDYRFSDYSTGRSFHDRSFSPVRYEVTNRWLTKSEVTKLPQYATWLARQPAEVRGNVPRAVMFISVAVVTMAFAGALILKRHTANSQTTNPQ